MRRGGKGEGEFGEFGDGNAVTAAVFRFPEVSAGNRLVTAYRVTMLSHGEWRPASHGAGGAATRSLSVGAEEASVEAGTGVEGEMGSPSFTLPSSSWSL